MKKTLLSGIMVTMMSLLMVGCGGGTAPVATSGKVIGKVLDYSTGGGLSGVTVKSGSHETTTTSDGSYILSGVANGDRVVVGAKKIGFAATSKIVTLSNSVTEVSLNMSLIPVGFTGAFASNADFVVSVAGSPAKVYIGAGSLVDANGNAPTGDITAELTPINPAIDINLMPGDMTTSAGDPIASYGAIAVNFTDASGNELNLDSGEDAIIRIPVANQGSGAVPATIPLYYYDEELGVWKEDGAANLSADGTYYEGRVSHFSTWNADYLYETVRINGCVQDEDGTRIANTLISLQGFDYNGMSSSRSNSEGNFSIDAMKEGTSLIVASTSDKVSNTAKVYAYGDVNMTDCLILGDVPLTVRLTWGLNPNDLDTHVIGPNNYHIWYIHKGSLSADEFAQLDVDDTTSYGPEVFTALSFPEAGTYHYAIYLFDGSSTIAASPARVELTLNGEKTVFTPPAGTSTEWWNVFDIIVDDNGGITIEVVQTWADAGPSSSKMTKVNMPSKVN